MPRLYLRRFLIPHFNLTFSTRDSIELEPSEFEAFLLNPKDVERKMRLKSASDIARIEKREFEKERQLTLDFERPTE